MAIPWKLLIGGWLLMNRKSGGGAPAATGPGENPEPYEINPDRPWGPGWERERPPELGPNHRRVGRARTANAPIEKSKMDMTQTP